MKRFGIGLILLVLATAIPAMAYSTPTNLKVVKPDGSAASNADYKIYYINGSIAVSGTLDGNGTASFNLTDNTTYIAVVTTTTETILDNFSIPAIRDPVNQPPVNITVNATTFKALNVSSALIGSAFGAKAPSVNVKLVPADYKNFSYNFNTNWTIYTPLSNNLTFPNETKSGIWSCTLKKITVDSTEYNNTTTVSIPMTANTNVVAYYEIKYPVLQPVYIIILVGLVGIALVAVVLVSGKKAKGRVRERIESDFRFYRRLK